MAGTTFSQFTPINVFPSTSGQTNKVLLSTGGGVAWDVVPIAAGGTGKTTAQAALDALTTGNLNLTASAARIRADFSNATTFNRTLFQTTTATAATRIGATPNGTIATGGVTASVELEDSTSINGNGSVLRIETVQATETRVVSGIRGSGTYLPLAFYTNNTRAVQFNNTNSNTVVNVYSGTAASAYSQLVLTSSASNGYVQILSAANNGTPYGHMSAGLSTMPMYYDFKMHAFRTQAGGNLFVIGEAGQLGVGSSVSYGTAGQFLMSNGASAAPSWSTNLPTNLTAVTQPAGTSNTTLATTEFVANSTVYNSQRLSGMVASTAATPNTIAQRDASGNLTANVFNGRATSALYADLAEKYTTDVTYGVGTVVVVGESEQSETTQSTRVGQYVLGVISDKPAHVMNSECNGQAIALVGRVPVRIVGPIRKGDRIAASDVAGCAYASSVNSFGTALSTNSDMGEKLVECAIIR